MDSIKEKDLIIIFFVTILACALNSYNIICTVVHQQLTLAILLTAATISAVIFFIFRISINIRKERRKSQISRS